MNPPLGNQAHADYQQAQALLAAKGKSFGDGFAAPNALVTERSTLAQGDALPVDQTIQTTATDRGTGRAVVGSVGSSRTTDR